MYKIILMFKAIYIFFIFCLGSSLFAKDYVDYVNCYMGNISHTLVPSLPTIQLPNSMLRVYPKRQDFATWGVEDFALCSVSHRNIFSANGILPFASDFPPELSTLDNEKITPFSYYAILDKQEIACDFATSYRSAIYSFNFEKADPSKSRKIRIRVDDGTIYFDKENSILNIIQNTGKYGETKMYIALVFDSEIKDVSIASFSRKPEENPIIKPKIENLDPI